MKVSPPDFSHQVMQIAGIVDIEPDGKTAKGRWYAFGGIFIPREGSVRRSFVSGIYEMTYIKEDGIWKILQIYWFIPYSVRIAEGWSMPESLGERLVKGDRGPRREGPSPDAAFPEPDLPIDKEDLRYVSGFILPHHFKHPVTGKESTEAKRNAKLKPLSVD